MNAAQGVVFDLDGTLIDSLPDLAAALNRSLSQHEKTPIPRAEVAPMVGDGAKILLQRGYAARGLVPSAKDEAAFLADYEAHVTDLTECYPGIPEALAMLAASGYRIGLCTNKPENSARKVLKALDIIRFFPVVIGGETTHRKPDPRHLGAVLEALEVDPASAVMVGDHKNDLATAAGLSVPAIFVTWGYGRAEAAFAVDRAEELLPTIRRILGPVAA